MFCQTKSYVAKQLIIAFCLNIGHILVGFNIGWSAPMIPLLQNPSKTPLSTVITETQGSLIGSSYLLGSIPGFMLLNLSDIIGRKSSILLGGVLSIISAIVLTTARSFIAIIVGRITFGVATLLIAAVNLIYIGEIASTNLRGLILTSTGIFHTLGVLLSYSVGPNVSYTNMGYIEIILSVVHVATNLSIPESPIFYALKGNDQAIKKSLDKLGRDKDLENIMKLKVDRSTQTIGGKSALIEIFMTKNNRKALMITVALCAFQLGGGILAVSFFATNIFESAGSSVEPSIATIIIGATSFSGALVTPIFVENVGRRILLLISSALCCTFMAVLGWYFYLVEIGSPLVLTLGWLPLASLVISVFGFGVGLNIIPNTLLGELFSPKVRSIGSSITMIFGSFAGFAVSSSFATMVNALGSHGTFGIFSIINAVAFIFTLVFVPETKGKSLLEIEDMLKG